MKINKPGEKAPWGSDEAASQLFEMFGTDLMGIPGKYEDYMNMQQYSPKQYKRDIGPIPLGEDFARPAPTPYEPSTAMSLIMDALSLMPTTPGAHTPGLVMETPIAGDVLYDILKMFNKPTPPGEDA